MLDVRSRLLDVQGSLCGLIGVHGNIFDVPVAFEAAFFVRGRVRLTILNINSLKRLIFSTKPQ